MIRHTLTLLLLCIGPLAAAQPPHTLRSYLTAGLERNYSIRIVRNEERISTANATAAHAGQLPTVSLSAGYTGRLDDTRTQPRNGASSRDNGTYDQTFDAGLSVNWTAFEGFRLRVERATLEEMKAKGILQTRLAIEEFIAGFTAEYYNFVQQKLRLNNYRYALALSRERLRIAEEWYRVGSSARLEVLQARVDFNADSSRYMSQQESVTSSRIRLNELLASDDLDRRLDIADTLIHLDTRLEWESLQTQTRTNNASLLLADRDLTLSELDLKRLRSRNYPYVRLQTGYGYTHNRYGGGPNRTNGRLGLNAGIQAGITLFDGNRRREQRNAELSIANSELTLRQLEQSLMADLSNFWQAYRNNLEVLRLERENLTAARENYRIAMERYRQGELPGIEMREAQKSLLDAEERILTAQYNTKLCEISLQQISGNIGVYLQ